MLFYLRNKIKCFGIYDIHDTIVRIVRMWENYNNGLQYNLYNRSI